MYYFFFEFKRQWSKQQQTFDDVSKKLEEMRIFLIIQLENKKIWR